MTAPAVTPGPWRLAARVAGQRPRLYAISVLLWGFFFVAPLASGLLIRAFFNALEEDDASRSVYWLVAAFGAVELSRRAVVHAAGMLWIRVWVMMETHMQANLLSAQVATDAERSGPPVDRTGEALSRFRDDPRDVVWFLDAWIDMVGALVFTAGAVVLMVAIDPWLTLVALAPLLLVVVVVRVMGVQVKRAHKAHLDAASTVSGMLRDSFAAVTTLRLGAAERAVTAAVRDRVTVRSQAAVRDRVLTEGIRSVGGSICEVAVGLVLLAAAGPLQRGELSVGDLAFFVTYISFLAFLPRMTGHLFTRRRQSGVAFERMAELVPGGRSEAVVAPFDLHIDEPRLTLPRTHVADRRPLRRLDVRTLTFRHVDGGGISDVSFGLERGELVVVSGPVGSGKTTLLRALLGLVAATGEVRWNGELIPDRGAFLVPPHAAYLPQLPQLFSDSIAHNVLMGHTSDDGDLHRALVDAALDGDVARMTDGSDTVIGPRGLRLSGGQRQRVAAARAMVRSPELLVVDDLSSAVDIETELALWTQVRAAGTTVLAVSNRPAARRLADRIIELP